jgi:hypothetical protein
MLDAALRPFFASAAGLISSIASHGGAPGFLEHDLEGYEFRRLHLSQIGVTIR